MNHARHVHAVALSGALAASLVACVPVDPGDPGDPGAAIARPDVGAQAPAEPYPYEECPDGVCELDEVGPLLATGGFESRAVDLRVPGRGLDFVWARRYRSDHGEVSALGHGWDYSYNVYLERAADGAILVHDGNNHPVAFAAEASGVYSAPGYHRELRPGDRGWTMTFADGGRWHLAPLDGSAGAGKLRRIEDRNGNHLDLAYDRRGRLVEITDTLRRRYFVAYSPSGQLASLRDEEDRVVSYEHGGSGPERADLVAVTLPAVTGTSTGNDFPLGTTWRYSYSRGTGDPELDHNLLTVEDPLGHVVLRNRYAATTDPDELDYDHLIAQSRGASAATDDFNYERDLLDDGREILLVTVNDRVGVVSDFAFDGQRRLLRSRTFTGFADPDRPSGIGLNRPTGKLRPGDPELFARTFEYNADHQIVRETSPAGVVVTRVYAGDLSATVRPRRRGVLIELHQDGAADGSPCDDPRLTMRYAYDPRFGSEHGWQTFRTSTQLPGGRWTGASSFDARGNLVAFDPRWPGGLEEYTYDAFGQPLRHVHAQDELGRRQVDEWSYFGDDAGTQRGRLNAHTVDAGGLALRTSWTYDRWGNVATLTDARGETRTLEWNSRGRMVSETRVASTDLPPAVSDTLFDADMRVVEVRRLNHDELGVLRDNQHLSYRYEYDLGGNETATVEELADGSEVAIAIAYGPDEKAVLVESHSAVAGEDPFETVTTQWDERKFTYRTTLAAGTEDELVTQEDYDLDGDEAARIVDVTGTPRVSSIAQDCHGREVASTDPMGNVRRVDRDREGQVTRSELWGELVDVPGSAGNRLLSASETRRDEYGREIAEVSEHFLPSTGEILSDGQRIERTEYDGRGRAIRTIDDRGGVTRNLFDTAGRRTMKVYPDGSSSSFELDGEGWEVGRAATLERSDGLAAGEWEIASELDGMAREVAETNEVAATRTWAYDAVGDVVRATDHKANETRTRWDGPGRLALTALTLTDDGTGGGAVVGKIVTQEGFDAGGRVVAQTDGLGHTTTYRYDHQGRQVETTRADGTLLVNRFGPASDIVETLDPNGTRKTMTYDLLGRVATVTVDPGPAVDGATTFERYAYSGASQQVLAQDEDSLVEREYDSLGYLVEEVVDGAAVTYERSGAGDLVALGYPSGRELRHRRDELGRLRAIEDEGETLVTQEFEGPDEVVVREYPPQRLTASFTYDPARRLTHGRWTDTASATVATIIDERAYTWDAAGNQVGETGSGGDVVATYDSAHRMVSAVVSGSQATDRSVTYELDDAGNWTAQQGGRCAGTYEQSGADALVNQYTATGCDTRGYSPLGELTRTRATSPDGRDRDLEYDHEGRLTLLRTDPGTPDQTTLRLRYDATGRLLGVERRRGPADELVERETRSYDGWRLLERRVADCEADDPEDPDDPDCTEETTTYLHADGEQDLLSARDTEGDDHLVITDALGSTVAVARRGGDGELALRRWEYEDYGYPHELSGPAPDAAADASLTFALGPREASPSLPLFAGMLWLEDAELYEARTRYLDPVAGRFITPDSIGTWGDVGNLGNAFAYVANNPRSAVDLFGMRWTPNYTNCGPSHRDEIWGALKVADEWSTRAKKQIEFVNDGVGKAERSRYYESHPLKKWFGTYSNKGSFNYLKDQIRDIQKKCDRQTNDFRCTTTDGRCDEKSISAFTERGSWHSTVRLCRYEKGWDSMSFFFVLQGPGGMPDLWPDEDGDGHARRPQYGKNSNTPLQSLELYYGTKGSHLAHEFSHNVSSKIRDRTYILGEAEALAKTSSWTARTNASSYQMFIHSCGEGLGAKRCD